MTFRRALLIAAAASLLIAGSASVARAATPPPNDDRAQATSFTTVPAHFQGDTTAATLEAGEDTGCWPPTDKTVWWRFTLAEATQLQISTGGSDFDTLLNVWRTGEQGLQFEDCDDNGGPDGTSRLVLNAAAGQSYLVQVGGHQDAAGNFGHVELDFTTVAPLGNDAFSDAIHLGTAPFNAEASNSGATTEAGEPVSCDGATVDRTVWFSWTAPADGLLDLYAFDRVTAVYTGSSLATLDQVGCGGSEEYFWVPVPAGQTIHLQVGVTHADAPAMFILRGVFTEQPLEVDNDDLVDAVTIAAIGEAHSGSTARSSVEPDERLCPQMATSKTNWYRYTPSEDVKLSVWARSSTINTELGVYTGTSHGDLTLLGCNGDALGTSDSRVNLSAKAGQTYLIQVGDTTSTGGAFEVEVLRQPLERVRRLVEGIAPPA